MATNSGGTRPRATTSLDLDAVRARAAAAEGVSETWDAVDESQADVPTLVAEVERLQCRVRSLEYDFRIVEAVSDGRATRLTAVEAALSNHPDVCDRYTEGDIVGCGWKSAVIDVRAALVD